jgi:hypothetical protein
VPPDADGLFFVRIGKSFQLRPQQNEKRLAARGAHVAGPRRLSWKKDRPERVPGKGEELFGVRLSCQAEEET